jgi:hypothetical protein
MTRSTFAGSVAACFYLGLVTPLLAAQPAPTSAVTHPSPGDEKLAAVKPAKKCLGDLLAFDKQMERTATGWADPAMATAIRWTDSAPVTAPR